MKRTALLMIAIFCAGILITAFARPAYASDEFAYLLSEITSLQTSLMLLEEKISNYGSSISSLESDVRHLKEETEPKYNPYTYSNPDEQKKTLRAEVEDMKSDMETLKSEISSLKFKDSDLEDEISSLKSKSHKR